MKRGEREAVELRDIAGRFLSEDPGEEQISILGLRPQRRTDLLPALREKPPVLTQQFLEIPDSPEISPEVAQESRPEIAVHVLPDPHIRSACHRGKPGLLREADQVGWNDHAHIMSAAQQLSADGNTRLDITTCSIK
ncbi:Uncharacterised protein [Mycobacteroides abscessus subsp. abscessus]|nr:Uncharacterised protein [Mycobacteroides abscessus subsp. abscessus]